MVRIEPIGIGSTELSQNRDPPNYSFQLRNNQTKTDHRLDEPLHKIIIIQEILVIFIEHTDEATRGK